MNDKELRISLIRQYLIKYMDLVNVLNKDEFLVFCSKFTNYLRNNRINSLLEKTDSEIKRSFNNFINFCTNLGIDKKEMIKILSDNFSLLYYSIDNDLINKYLLLSVIENKDNTIRKNVLLTNSRVFSRSIEEMYARYELYKRARKKISISGLTLETHKNFINKFLSTQYVDRFYKILKKPLSENEFIEMFPVDYEFINELKYDKKNSNVSYKRNMSKEDKVFLAIKNYNNVENLKQLSNLLNISTSSLQRYLKEDSRKYLTKEDYQKIVNWLNNAKVNGNTNGGKKSQELFGFKKDDIGHFVGKGK